MFVLQRDFGFKLLASMVGFLTLLALSPERMYGYHTAWDQQHDLIVPGVPPDERSCTPPCDPCSGNSTGSPVYLATGRYFRADVDLSIPARGMPLEIARTHNTQDRHNGLFGYGWVFNLATRLVLVSDGANRYAIVRMPDGRRFQYRQTSDTTFASPSGDFSTLTKRGDGTYEIAGKDGSKETFNADGNLTAIIDRYGNRLSLTYTADGFIGSVSDGAGRSIRFTLNANGKIASLTDYTNRTINYTYDSAGHLTQVRDAGGNTTTYTYDANHNLTRITDPLNNDMVRITYDAQGRVTRLVDADGDFTYRYGVGETSKISNAPIRDATWTYKYDSRGILTEMRDPLGGIERYVYDTNGQLTQLTDKNGNITRYEYDGRGNRITRIDPAPLNYVTRFTYEPVFNRLTSVTDPRGIITRYEYDAQGNLTRLTEAAGQPEQRTTQYEYDAFGYVTRIIYPDQTTERFTYDSAGRLLTRTDALKNTISYTYDPLGRLLSATDPNNHTTRYEYDAMNRITAIIDALNNRTEFTYDEVSNRVTSKNAVGEITRYSYDAFRQPLTITDPYGNITTYTYDANGNRTSRLNPNGKIAYYKYDELNQLVKAVQKVGETTDRITSNDAVTEYTYDSVGNRTSIKDPNGNTTRFEYDFLNRILREISPNGLTVTYAYDAVDNITRTQRSDGYVRTFVYDQLNRLIREANSIGSLASYTYDVMGRRTSVTDANNNTIRGDYDAVGRLVTITDPLGRTTSIAYDDVGNMLQQSDREGQARSFTYDELNRLKTMTDAIASTTTFSYDGIGRRTALLDGNGNMTTLSYGNVGTRRVIRRSYVDGAFMEVEFDGVGNRVRRIDPNGVVTTYAYDDLNHLVRRSYPGGSDDVFTYDKGGRMLTATNANAAVTYEYDTINRLTRTTQNAASVTYQYNEVGTERTLTYPGGRRIKETYDGRYRLQRVDNLSPTSNTLVQFTYDLGDRLVSKRLLNDVVTDFSYDSNDNITRLVAQRSGTTRVGFEYRFDREDNRLLSKRLHDLGNSERYVYDPIYRLSQFQRGLLDGSGEIPSPNTQSNWTLDSVGNWSSLVVDGVTETRTHNELNQIISADDTKLAYDANGNLIDDGVNRYMYNYENRLIQVTRQSDGQVLARFRYDALKRRVEKEVSGVITRYLYDGLQVIEERENNRPTATYVFGRGMGDVLEMERSGQHSYYHPNSMWTIEAMSDAAGAIVERYLYDPYGRVRFFNGAGQELTVSALSNPHLFTAQRWDVEVRLYDYRARHYHPGLGRFIQRDPITEAGGLNLYAYVHDDPINRADPLGFGTLFGSGAAWDRAREGYGTAHDAWKAGNYGTAIWEAYKTSVVAGSDLIPFPTPIDIYRQIDSGSKFVGELIFGDTADTLKQAGLGAIGYTDAQAALSSWDEGTWQGKVAAVLYGFDALGNLVTFAVGAEKAGAGLVPRGRLPRGLIPPRDAPRLPAVNNPPRNSPCPPIRPLRNGPPMGFRDIPDYQRAWEDLARAERPRGWGNVGGGEGIAPDRVLTYAQQWLGEGYRQIADGIWRSADGTRQFRITPSDLAGHDARGPHAHFETIGPDGRAAENSHVYLGR